MQLSIDDTGQFREYIVVQYGCYRSVTRIKADFANICLYRGYRLIPRIQASLENIEYKDKYQGYGYILIYRSIQKIQVSKNYLGKFCTVGTSKYRYRGYSSA